MKVLELARRLLNDKTIPPFGASGEHCSHYLFAREGVLKERGKAQGLFGGKFAHKGAVLPLIYDS